MKKDYEPVELTDDTPEPKDEGIYFLYSPCIAPNLVFLYHSSEDWELVGETVTWLELIKGRNMKEKITIQSLANHDIQMRAEAWDEGHERGWMDGVENAEPTSPNPYRKENYLYKSNGSQHEEQ